MLLKHPRLFIGGLVLFICAVYVYACTNWDNSLSQFFILSPSDVMLPVVKFISKMGSFMIVTPLAIILSVWFWMRQKLYDAIWIITTMAGCRIFFAFIKLIVERHRPVFPEPLTHAITASFPSGHSVNSLTLLLVCYFMFNRRAWILCVAIIGAITIGWTRLALGAHWTSDVLAGWGGAMMWVAVALQIKESPIIQSMVYKYLPNRSR